MKKYLALLLLLLLTATVLVACGEDAPASDTEGETLPVTADTTPDPVTDTVGETASETASETLPETLPETESPYAPIDPATLTAEKAYDNDHGSVLSAYPGKTAEDYEGVCVYYEKAGYELYCENAWNGNLYSTYRKGAEMAHVYWIESDGELNIARSETNGENLPPKDGGALGTGVTSITQLQQNASQTSGLAYIVQLSDGSFIIFDGAYSDTAKQLVKVLHDLHGDGEVHIRAWIMSHAHDDHYSCIQGLSRRMKMHLADYSMTLKLDSFVIAPISDADTSEMGGGDFYIKGMEDCIAKFPGAKIVYAHTGMTMQFSDMKLDFLYTGDDLFIDGSTGYFNDSSMVTRLSSARPEGGDTLSMIFLGDAGVGVADRLMRYYGDFLKSDMCQISHHGVENFPLAAYEMIAAPTLFYPCNNGLYALTDRDADVRAALRNSEVTKEILLRDNDQYTRYFDPSRNPEPIGKPDATGFFPEEP